MAAVRSAAAFLVVLVLVLTIFHPVADVQDAYKNTGGPIELPAKALGSFERAAGAPVQSPEQGLTSTRAGWLCDDAHTSWPSGR
jgi:hypothetical protein